MKSQGVHHALAWEDNLACLTDIDMQFVDALQEFSGGPPGPGDWFFTTIYDMKCLMHRRQSFVQDLIVNHTYWVT